MNKEDTIKCFLDCKGKNDSFQLTLTNKDIDVITNEIERLNNKYNELEKLNNANYQSFIETNKIIIEFEKFLKEEKTRKRYANDVERFTAYDFALKKLQELKGSDK